MRELAGKAAFVTGGASGIGLAMATAFAREGMKVMLADVEPLALDRAVDALRGSGADVRGVVCDVADPASVDRAAEAAFGAFEVEGRFDAILAAIDAVSAENEPPQ